MSLWFVDMNQRVKKPRSIFVFMPVNGCVCHAVPPDNIKKSVQLFP